MVETTAKWPCVQCNGENDRAVDRLAEILRLAAISSPPQLPLIAHLVAKCLAHPNTTGMCPNVAAHCTKVAEALAAAQTGDWPACITALDHP